MVYLRKNDDSVIKNPNIQFGERWRLPSLNIKMMINDDAENDDHFYKEFLSRLAEIANFFN